MDIEINTLGDSSSDKLDLHADLDIFSGGGDKNVHDRGATIKIPNLSDVESNIRGSATSTNTNANFNTKSNEGFASKVTNFLGFGMSSDSSQTERLKTSIDEVRSDTPRTSGDKWGGGEYNKVNSTSVRSGYSSFANDSNKKAKPPFTASKRYFLEKIGFYVRKLNELRETQTTTEISAYNTMDEIKAEFEELRNEYNMAAAISGYGKTIISGAASLEALGGIIDGFPLKTDGLENAITLSMNERTEEFEQIYERYGSVEINPLITVGASIISTIIKTHLAHSFMDMYGPDFENDAEINNILQERANKLGDAMAKASTADLASAVKPMANRTPAAANNTNFSSNTEKAESNFQSGFHFADDLIQKNKLHGGPPPPISTKITKPPATEETAAQIKKMSQQNERPSMKGPSTLPSVDDFLGVLNKSEPPITHPPALSSPPPHTESTAPAVHVPAPGKKSRGRKSGSSATVSIDI